MMWAINDEVLKALAESDAWKKSPLEKNHGFTTQIIYGPNGKLLQYWGSTWVSAAAMQSDLCFNMGGGVPIEIIRELVALSKDQVPESGAESN
jgi:hypothetical protein